MRLSSLLEVARGRRGVGDAPLVGADEGGATDPEVVAVVHDTAAVVPGALFCCVPGSSVDGHELAATAVAAGAVALLVERPVAAGVPEVRVASVRAALGPLCAAFHGDPSHDLAVVGVTGTNGKTTTVHLVAAILDAAGLPCEVIGTLTGARTTPPAPELQQRLAAARSAGRAAVAMEVSSHALVQQRVDGTRFAVACFTNLSQDHLDYHRTMEEYFQAKARLFDPDLAARAVVCADDPHGRLLLDAALVPTVPFGLADAHDVDLTAAGTSFTWRGERMHVGLAGRFNLRNAIGAATVAAEIGVAPATVAAGLAAAPPVPGRFELVDAGQPFLVAVDYAHTPDGLVQVLGAARELAGAHRVLLVFGAGGDRDREKRAPMGAAAVAGADLAIVTSDNPRSEDPSAIIEDVLAGIPDSDDDGAVVVQPDRRAAIAAAVAAARPGDVVVIAGKGHETTQQVGDVAHPFDDRAVAREELSR